MAGRHRVCRQEPRGAAGGGADPSCAFARRPVIGELELAWRLLDNPFVAVTGTNGKTTVSELLGHIWRTAESPVAVAGNVGTPLASLSGEIEARTTVICEASSFQLEDATAFAPECALLLNATPDHLDRHGTFEHYLASKLGSSPARPPRTSRSPIAPTRSSPRLSCPERRERLTSPKPTWASAGGEWMRGPHNRTNARFAATAALAMGIGTAEVERGINTFPGVPHRLEHVADIGGVAYVNDSKATNVAAAIAAIESFDEGVHALMGGSLKGGDFELLADPVARRCAAVYLTGPAADPIADALEPTGVELVRCADLENAVSRAAKAAGEGSTVLLAPACASFDAYSDYAERGDHFRRLVRAMEAALSAKARKPPAKPKVKPKVSGKRKPVAKRKSSYPIEHSIILTTTLCLLALGVVMVFSASSTTSLLGDAGDGAFYLKRTALFGIFGLIALRLLSVNGVNMLRP